MSANLYLVHYDEVDEDIKVLLTREVLEELADSVLIRIGELPGHYIVPDEGVVDELLASWDISAETAPVARLLSRRYSGQEITPSW